MYEAVVLLCTKSHIHPWFISCDVLDLEGAVSVRYISNEFGPLSVVAMYTCLIWVINQGIFVYVTGINTFPKEFPKNFNFILFVFLWIAKITLYDDS